MRISDWSSDVCSSDLGTFELATAMLFDIGVAVTMVGAVMLALAELSHIAQRAEQEERIDDEPMNVDPARHRKEPAWAWSFSGQAPSACSPPQPSTCACAGAPSQWSWGLRCAPTRATTP